MSDYSYGLATGELELREGARPRSVRFDDDFHSDRGIAEKEYVFLELNRVEDRWPGTSRFTIGEIGFGLGLTFLATLRAWSRRSPAGAALTYISFEQFPVRPNELLSLYTLRYPELAEMAESLFARWPHARGGFHVLEWPESRARLILALGDANLLLPELRASVDAWFLDGFAPGKNPELWNESICREIAARSVRGTTLSTYSSSEEVRARLVRAGFEIETVAGIGSKRHSMRGVFHRDRTPLAAPWLASPAPASKNGTVTVIGAGIAGAATAWSLGRRGFEVLVVDAHGDACGGASGNSAALAAPYVSIEPTAAARLYIAGLDFANRILAGIEAPWWRSTGALQLLSARRFERLFEALPALGLPATVACRLSPEETRDRSGMLLDGASIFYPGASLIDPHALVRHLLASSALRYGSRIESLTRSGNRWELRGADGFRHLTDIAIVAGSYESGVFSETRRLPLEPVRGQVVDVSATGALASLACPVSYDGYALPGARGEVTLGASFEHGAFEETPTSSISETLIARARSALLLEAPPRILRERVSFRASTIDRLPYVGAVPDYSRAERAYAEIARGFPWSHFPALDHVEGLYVNAGHGSRGFTGALLCAEILAATIEGDAHAVEGTVLDSLHPIRPLVRALRNPEHAVSIR